MTDMLPHSTTPPPLWREALGRALRLRRTDMGLTLAQVSEQSGVSTQFLSEIERGLKDPSSEVIEAVVEVLGLQLPQILVLAAVGMTSGTPATTLLSAADMTQAAPSPPTAGQVRLALAA
jgi:transcriptional regulator with XRE-family HTH domain